MQSYRGAFTGGTVQGASERRAGPPVRHSGRRLITRWLAAAAVLAMPHEAAAQGHAKAQARLGVLYESGRGTEPDPKEAEKWYRRASELGLLETGMRAGT